MSDQKCPQCGEEYMERDSKGTQDWVDVYRCGSEIDKNGVLTYEPDECLRNQLATQTARAIKYIKTVEENDLEWSEKLRLLNKHASSWEELAEQRADLLADFALSRKEK